ncbi:MAG: hypothetical protein Q9170_002524 [Blastenia crenularia]
MQSFLVILTLLGLSFAVPTPQLIDTAGVEAAPDPVFVIPAYDVPEQAGTTNEPDIAPRSRLHKRDGTCAAQPAGSGPVSSPDTVDAFLDNPVYAALANNASTPDGYSIVMQNGGGSLSASNYMGLKTLKSYDTLGCASLCDQASGCQAFNMYIERDPTLDPNVASCPNPPSLTNYKCTLWGAAVSAAEATNKGQWRDSFQVVIAGSNAYNKASPPPGISCYTGPVELGGAINAPYNAQGQNTYMGYKYHPFSQSQGYDPSTCAADCNSQTAYNKRHPAADGSYQTCIFFNAYVLSMNGIPQGLYCSMYTQVWAASYATNYGQYRGTDRYTVSRSYSYSLNLSSDGSGSCGSITTSQSSTSTSTSRSSTAQSTSSQSTTSQSTTSSLSSAQTSTSSTIDSQALSTTAESSVATSAATLTTSSNVNSQTTISEPSTSPTSTSELTPPSISVAPEPTLTTSEATSSQSTSEVVTTSVTPTTEPTKPALSYSESSSETTTTSTSDSNTYETTTSQTTASSIPTTETTVSQLSTSEITKSSMSSDMISSSSSTSTSLAEPSISSSSSSSMTTTSTSTTSLTSLTPTSTTSSSTTSSCTTSSSTTSSSTILSSTTSSTSTISSSTTSSSSTASATPTSLPTFCLQNPSTGQFASLSKTGNGLSFDVTSPKHLPSLFTLSTSSILTSTKTGLIAVLNLATFGKDGLSEGHVEGTTLDQLAKNQNHKPLECSVGTGMLMCRSAGNYIDAVKTPAGRSQVDTTTKGKDGVDQYVFAPTSVQGAVGIRVLPASACGPNYS